MTPAEKRAHAESLMALARCLMAEAGAEDANGAEASAGAAREARPARDRILDTTQARRIANRESSTLYRWARRYGVGWKAAGQWRFSEEKLRAVMMAGERGEVGEVGDAGPVQMAKRATHIPSE